MAHVCATRANPTAAAEEELLLISITGETLLLLSAPLFNLFVPSDFKEISHMLVNWQQHNLPDKLLAELCNDTVRSIKFYASVARAEITAVVMSDFTTTL